MVNVNKSRLLRDIEEILEREVKNQNKSDKIYTLISERIESFCWELQENLGKAFTSID